MDIKRIIVSEWYNSTCELLIAGVRIHQIEKSIYLVNMVRDDGKHDRLNRKGIVIRISETEQSIRLWGNIFRNREWLVRQRCNIYNAIFSAHNAENIGKYKYKEQTIIEGDVDLPPNVVDSTDRIHDKSRRFKGS